MQPDQIKELLESFNAETKAMFLQRKIDYDRLSEIALIINQMDPKTRKFFKEYYLAVHNELFTLGRILPSFDTEIFDSDIQEEVKKEEEFVDNFNDIFVELIKYLKKDHKILRRHFFFKMGDGRKSQTNILLLHDYHSKNYLFDRVKGRFDDICTTDSISDFIAKLKKEPELRNKSFLCFLFLSPNMSSIEIITEMINELKESFTPFALLTRINYTMTGDELYFENNDPMEIDKEIRSQIGIELINDEIDPNTSRAIRRLFLNAIGCHTLEYRILKGGYSGSKVILIQPHKDVGKQYKCVIKVNKIKDNKIKEEIINFNTNVLEVDKEYTIDHAEYEDTIAIKYPYASSDGRKESTSFAEFYELNDEKDCANQIDNLFNITLFEEWDDPKTRTVKAIDLYFDYTKETKIFPVIEKILAKPSPELLKDFGVIINHPFKTRLKTCHGDLHSENFFIEKGAEYTKIYLIDFGHTKRDLHSVIDHTTLEASLKFKHIPNYFSIDELLEIENELLLPDTFKKDYAFSSINRQDLEKPFRIINRIREHSNRFIYDEGYKLDYYISLFMITLRQILYPNLFQLYALKSAQLISKHILNIISQSKI